MYIKYLCDYIRLVMHCYVGAKPPTLLSFLAFWELNLQHVGAKPPTFLAFWELNLQHMGAKPPTFLAKTNKK